MTERMWRLGASSGLLGDLPGWPEPVPEEEETDDAPTVLDEGMVSG